MKKVFAYSAIVLLLAAAVACNKTDSAISGDGQIRFALTSPETRALVESVDDLKANQSIKVFDFLDGTNYFDANESVTYKNGNWVYDTGNGYTWKTGSHTFFGYTKDNACSISGKLVTVSKTLHASADEADIVYSNIVTKTAAQAKEDNYAAVGLNMDHLFAAVAITLKNATSSAVTVKSVTTNIPNKGSATIDYSGETPAVTWNAVSQDGQYITATALANAEVAADGLVDVLAQAAATADGYWLVWPQTHAKGDLKVTVSYTMNNKDYDAEVSLPATPEGGWLAGHKYLYTLNIYPTEVQLTFKVQPWDQQTQTINTATGSINMSNVTWMNSKVFVGDVLENTLNNSRYSVYMYKDAYLAVPQYYEEDEYAEDGTTIIHKQGDPILDDEGNQTYEKGSAYPQTYVPAQGYFTVNYPSSGLFLITLIQAAYWNNPVPEGMYEIWIYDDSTKAFRPMKPAGETITNNTVYFQVRATSNVPATHEEYRAQVDIFFKPTGGTEWISAYSEVRANYACVIPAVN
ncbi:MAG: fimbrillin family protein [Bacteroidales bacterium]|nr:fimbrillin family protein [Bacteroidales bacterium]